MTLIRFRGGRTRPTMRPLRNTSRSGQIDRQCGAPGRNRTVDTRFRKPLLYPLSYEGRQTRSSRFKSIASISYQLQPCTAADLDDYTLRSVENQVALRPHESHSALWLKIAFIRSVRFLRWPTAPSYAVAKDRGRGIQDPLRTSRSVRMYDSRRTAGSGTRGAFLTGAI